MYPVKELIQLLRLRKTKAYRQGLIQASASFNIINQRTSEILYNIFVDEKMLDEINIDKIKI